MFILKCLVDKYNNSKGNKFNACFVYFKWDFDSDFIQDWGKFLSFY